MKLVLTLLLALGATAQEPGEVADFDAELAMDNGNCVDISYWDEVQYQEQTVELCQSKRSTECVPRTEEVCREVPVHSCRVEGVVDCEDTPTTHTVQDDAYVMKEFPVQKCQKSAVPQQLTETKQMPVCVPVTKQQCDSKWEVQVNAETGEMEKVWAGNENCREVTWEDCSLETREVTQQVDTWDCAEAAQPLHYQEVEHGEAEVTTITRKCAARAVSVCSVRVEEQCSEVEWEECRDSVQPHCFPSLVRIPSQEYNHLLRCSVHR